MTIYLQPGEQKLVRARLTDAASQVNDDTVNSWTSNNPCVSVEMSDANNPNVGIVKGISAGTATVTATSTNNVTGTITVTVHTGVTTTVTVTD